MAALGHRFVSFGNPEETMKWRIVRQRASSCEFVK